MGPSYSLTCVLNSVLNQPSESGINSGSLLKAMAGPNGLEPLTPTVSILKVRSA